jgi:hypothetical protein
LYLSFPHPFDRFLLGAGGVGARILFVFHKARQWLQKVNLGLFNEMGWGNYLFLRGIFLFLPNGKSKWDVAHRKQNVL